MEKHIDLTGLPKKKHGEQEQIDWKKSEGYQVPFVYGHISGEITILEYQKGNYIKIGYENQSKTMRTHNLMEMKITDLFSATDRGKLNSSTKTQEEFVKEVEEMYQGQYEIL